MGCNKCNGKELQRTLSFDPENGRSLSVLIPMAVAEEKGIDMTDLAPLRGAVDIDGVRAAIDAVQENSKGTACISFAYETYLVTVSSDGTIKIAKPT